MNFDGYLFDAAETALNNDRTEERVYFAERVWYTYYKCESVGRRGQRSNGIKPENRERFLPWSRI